MMLARHILARHVPAMNGKGGLKTQHERDSIVVVATTMVPYEVSYWCVPGVQNLHNSFELEHNKAKKPVNSA